MSTPSAASQRRLFKDLEKIRTEELSGLFPSSSHERALIFDVRFVLGINATPVDNDLRVWNALIDGPVDTCYEDGLFTLRLEFTGNRDESQRNAFAINELHSRYVSFDAAQCSIHL